MPRAQVVRVAVKDENQHVKEEKERLKRAKENAKKRASRDRLKEQEQAATEATPVTCETARHGDVDQAALLARSARRRGKLDFGQTIE